jgi:hypothetical protein
MCITVVRMSFSTQRASSVRIGPSKIEFIVTVVVVDVIVIFAIISSAVTKASRGGLSQPVRQVILAFAVLIFIALNTT